LATFAWAADTDPLDMATLASLAAGVSTRRYAGTLGLAARARRAAVGVQERGVAALGGAESGATARVAVGLGQGVGPAGRDDRC